MLFDIVRHLVCWCCCFDNALSFPCRIFPFLYYGRFHRPICDLPRSLIGDDFPINVFARIHGTAFYKHMGGYFDGAEIRFGRKMNGLSENPVKNIAAPLETRN